MGWLHDDEDDPDGYFGWSGGGRFLTPEEAAHARWAAQARDDEANWLAAVTSGIGCVCALSAIEARFAEWVAALPVIQCRFVCWGDRSGWSSPPEFPLTVMAPETGAIMVLELMVRGDYCIAHANTWGDWSHGQFTAPGLIPGRSYELPRRPHVAPIQ